MSETTAIPGEVVEPKRVPRPKLYGYAEYSDGAWSGDAYENKADRDYDMAKDVEYGVRVFTFIIPAEDAPAADALRACVVTMKAVEQAFGDDDDPDGVVAQVLADHRDAIALAEAALGDGCSTGD